MDRSFIAVIAPGHKSYDERVRRTVEEFSRSHNVLYIYELDDAGPVKKMSGNGFQIIHRQFPQRGGSGLRARFKKISDLKEILKEYVIDCYYVHESGTFGLNIIQSIPVSKKIIFDYHDWIPFEIHEKFRNSVISNFVYALVKIYIKRVVRKIDAVVFISSGARDYFECHYSSVRSFVVPNSRNCYFVTDNPEKKLQPSAEKTKIELLWLGNVMRLRQLERLFKIAQGILLSRPLIDLKISIWGAEKDKNYANELWALAANLGLADCVVFNGSFVSEEHIIPDRHSISFGLAFGWLETYDTKINSISRPTKLLSYGLLGIVGLLESTCVSFHRELDASGLSLAFDSDEQAVIEILNLYDNKNDYQSTAAKFQQFCVDQSRESEAGVQAIAEFLNS